MSPGASGKPNMLRQLVTTVNECLRGASQRELDVKKIENAVNQIAADQVRVHRRDYVRPGEDPSGQDITYIHVGDCDDFLMAIFVLPPKAVIPLHDHPNMTVFSKVLWGSMEITSFDFVEESRRAVGNSNLRVGPARPANVRVVREGEVSVLRPWIGNVHSFAAREWTAVFDLAIPPYSNEADRPCTYYQVSPGRDGLPNLIPTDCPDWYVTQSGIYRGEQM